MVQRQSDKGFLKQPSEGAGAALYLRVSTSRQLKGEVSIPSQRRACQSHCETIGKVVVAEFIDGVTGTDDARTGFQSMIEAAQRPDCPFDTIVVHALSRFYRAGPEMELLIRKLRKKGVRVVSVTQPIGDDPSQALLRQVIGIFDEYTSLENGKNVRRAMRENALQGFWNGTTPPIGYQVVAAEQRGTKIKKKLAIDAANAEIVVAAYDFYLKGPPGAGPLGVKNTAKALNEAGHRTRRGCLFGVGPVHKLLTAEYYATGIYRWGVTSAKTGERNPTEEVIEIAIPPLISKDTFARVQEKLANHNHRQTPPRVVNGPCLLTGLAVCGTCGSGMTRTGTVRRRKRYSYYTCAGCHQKGPKACRGRHVPMAKLDTLVVGALKERLFAPDRLALLLQGLIDQQARQAADASSRLLALQSVADDAKARLHRLYSKIAAGILEEDEILKNLIANERGEMDKANTALVRARLQATPSVIVDSERIARFGRLMHERMDGADVNSKRGYIAAVVGAIEVHDERIRIVGRTDTLKQAIAGHAEAGKVRGFVRKWRARQGIDGHCDRWRISIRHPAAPHSIHTVAIGRSI